MTLTFKTTRKADYYDASGVGTFSVDIDFTPNFVDLVFHDAKHVAPGATPDSLLWDLTATATGYTFTVTYNTNEKRKVKYVLAKLPVNPEQTISF